MLFPFSLAGAARRWLEKESPRSIHTWEDLVFKYINEFFPPLRTTNLRNEISNFQQRFDESFHKAWDRYKDLLRACPHHGFTKLHQLDTFYNALNPADQDSLNAAAGGICWKDVLKQTSAATTAMTAILKQFQAIPPRASVKAVEEICVTCGGAHPYYQCLATGGNTFPELGDNIQGYVSAPAVNYNQGNSVYRPPEETLTDSDLSEYTIKAPPPPVQKYKPPSQIDYVVHQRDPLHLNIPYPSRMLKQKQQEKDEVQIHKFWQMFKQLHINITLADARILMPKYQKMLKALLSNKKKLQELANMSLNENCSAVILKKLPEKHGDPGKFLIPCSFSELKCKALVDLGASINLMPLSVWKKLANFVIVDYESDPRVPFILERPFLQTARALVDVHGEEMILRDGDKRLALNMRHDTSSYSNQPRKESINLINVFNNSSEDFLEDLFSNQPSGNPTFSSYPESPSPPHVNPLSGGTTYSSFPNPLLEELADELALITFPLKYDDDIRFDVESDLKEIEFMLHQDIDSSLKDSIDQSNLANLADNFVDSMPEMFTDEHALDYSSPLIFDEYDDDFLEVVSDTKNVYDDPFDSKGEKIKESKLLNDELDLPCDFLPPSEYDLFTSEDFFKVDALPLTNNEDKVFNPGILIQEKPFEIITRVVQDKKLAISNASLVLEDFDPPLYEPLFFKEVPRSNMPLPFSSENEEKVFKLGINTSEKVHSSHILEISHQGYKVFKINPIFKSPMKTFLFSCGKDIHILAVPCLHFYPLDQFKYGGIGSSKVT
nr:reverse transcriptase domain-containing protein [Tanacetum cinerariifolium]